MEVESSGAAGEKEIRWRATGEEGVVRIVTIRHPDSEP